jgi:hypothetical protein
MNSVARSALLLAVIFASVTLFDPASVEATKAVAMLRQEGQGEQVAEGNYTIERCCL